MRCSRDSAVHFKPHMHHAFCIGTVTEGEVLYSIEAEKGVLAPGSLILINPETIHACNPASAAERSYSMLYLDVDWCFQAQRSLWEVDAFVAVENTRIDDAPLYDKYCATVDLLMDEQAFLQEKEQMLFELVGEVFSIACKPRARTKERRGDVEKIKRMLSADLQKDLPLGSLAGEMDVNLYSLIRGFKAATGMTPHAYRMSCRIEKARELLRQGREIAQTALECGFFDQSHFHRYFKAMTTATPQEYRVNFVQYPAKNRS